MAFAAPCFATAAEKATIEYQLAKPARVSLAIYGADGRMVRTLAAV